jgi:hypothetical protein
MKEAVPQVSGGAAFFVEEETAVCVLPVFCCRLSVLETCGGWILKRIVINSCRLGGQFQDGFRSVIYP